MATGIEILADMGITLEEALEVDEILKAKKPRDRRVCLCGHGVVRHSDEYGKVQCRANKWNCKCNNIQPVLEVDDTRLYMRKTEGSGVRHALNRGILSAMSKGHEMSWIEGARVCHKCGADDVRVTVVSVSPQGVEQDYDTGYNAFLCDECRM